MALPSEVGRYLTRLRLEASVTQKEVAERASMYPGVLSKIESGERSITGEEMQRIVVALDTKSAHRFGRVWSQDWSNLERPPLGHPDEDLLWEGELCLAKIEQLRERLGSESDGTDPFQVRLILSEEEIKQAAALVRNLEHTVAFMGDIGVGKTKALCAISGLKVSRTPGGRLVEVLEVGTGRTTVCEVQVVQGPAYGLVVESLTDEEVEREVFEYSDFLKRTVESAKHGDRDDGGTTNSADSTGDPAFIGTPREISRCIRNMSRLTGPSTGTGDGRERVDPVMQLAQAAPDANTLAGEIVSRMNLQRRRRRELWYGPELGREPLVWLEEVFRQVNNGRHPDFSIPRVIEVMIPEDVLDEEILKLRLVDTKGIDTTVERADLESHLSDPGAVVVLCTGFNDAPAVSVQAVLERAQRVGIGGLDTKTAVLVLVYPGQALGAKYDDGTEVDTVEEGYAVKADQVWMQLGVRNVKCAAVEFFNCKEESPEQVKEALVGLVRNVRQRHCRDLSNMIRDASAMVDNYREERVVVEQKEASRRLRIWLDNNRRLPEFTSELEGSLLSAIQRAHHSSVRASARREGLWDNLDYGYLVGSGVRAVVDDIVNPRIVGFREVATNVANDLANAEDLVNQAVRMMEGGRLRLLTVCQDFGRTIHTYDMRSDKGFWASCDYEWGKGPGYRDRVLDIHHRWFGAKTHGSEGLKRRVREYVEGGWNALLDQVGSILG